MVSRESSVSLAGEVAGSGYVRRAYSGYVLRAYSGLPGDVSTCTKNYAVVWNFWTSYGALYFDLTVGHKSWPQTAKDVPYFVEKVRHGNTVSAGS